MMNNKSRMKGDFHVRICEKLGLKCPCLLDSAGCGRECGRLKLTNKKKFATFYIK